MGDYFVVISLQHTLYVETGYEALRKRKIVTFDKSCAALIKLLFFLYFLVKSCPERLLKLVVTPPNQLLCFCDNKQMQTIWKRIWEEA